MHQHFPSSRMISTVTHLPEIFFLATIKAQGLYVVANPDFDPDDGDQYDKQLILEKQSFVYSVLVTFLQTDKGKELVNEFEGDARTIISKLHHYHTESNVTQHLYCQNSFCIPWHILQKYSYPKECCFLARSTQSTCFTLLQSLAPHIF